MSNNKRNQVTKVILDSIEKIDSCAEGINIKRYKDMFKAMSDTQFDEYMKALRDKKTCIYMYLPNMTKRPSNDEILKIAKELNVNLFHRIKIYDSVTGTYFLTNEEYPVLRLPIRRLQQFLDKKLSVPHGDTRIDAMTGQVANDDKSATLSNPEIQALQSKGLNNVLCEFVNIRGGNVIAWNGEMKQQAEETGVVYLRDIGQGSVTRTAVVAQILFEGLMLETNLVEE